jgi:3-oxoadipate CoA-transferase alpha subunit
MIDKQVVNLADAVRGVRSGAVVLVSGFGDAGTPVELLEAGSGERGLAALLREGRVQKIITSYPRSRGSIWFEKKYFANEVMLEVVPQGTLSERIRAAGAGIGGFFTTTGAGTEFALGKESRMIGGREHLLEEPLFGDVALIKALRADRWGNLTYHASARNYGPTMVAAAQLAVVQVSEIVPLGAIDPEVVITPGVLVDRVVLVAKTSS